MASDSEYSSPYDYERLLSNRDLSLFMPFLYGFTNNSDPEEQDTDNNHQNQTNPARPRDRVFLVNPFTQSMVVIEQVSTLESLLRDLGAPDNNGHPPASKSSIEALPSFEIREGEEGECVICLDDWELETRSVAKELPCAHRFHAQCIDKWLRIHGSCPICRHKMPVDDQIGKRNRTDGRGSSSSRERGIWVGFSLSRDTRTDDDSDPIPIHSNDH